MSNKKSKVLQNNENLCPIVRKRVASATTTTTTTSSTSTPLQQSWKLAKLESTSSPTALTLEDLEEMGIGMLDSEESTSSAASAIALALSASADENSNEATPNLDATKFRHQSRNYHNIDVSLDTTIENGNNFNNNNSLTDSIERYKNTATSSNFTSAHATMLASSSMQRSNANYEQFADDQAKQLRSGEKGLTSQPPAQHKKVAILGVGAGLISGSNTSSNSSNSSSPSSGRATRSPLATVSSNTQVNRTRTGSPHHQIHEHIINQHIQMQQPSAATSQRPRILSPSQPSTSQNAANQRQQQQQQKTPHNHQLQSVRDQQQQHQREQQQQHQQRHQQISQMTSHSPSQREAFFLFRRPAVCNDDANAADNQPDDQFNKLSDEIILQILQWLPKKALLRCAQVNRRFEQLATDESLWTRLDLGCRSLRAGAMQDILKRGVVVLRLAQAQLVHPVFDERFLEQTRTNFETKLQYLDLSMATLTKPSLKMLLSRCRQLRKLSLEHVPVNDEICNEIAKNTQLEALNLAMCTGLEAWSVRKMMEALQNLNSLNISWTNLSVDAVTSLVTNITPNIMRLNIAGCRKTMFDSHLSSLVKRCAQLLELDLSDCSGLTGQAITIICNFKMLEYLSLSRCYLIPASSYMELSNLSTLTYLDIFGMLSDTAMELFQNSFPNLGINKFIHSSVARPTVGTRRTSVWGLRTRD